MVCVTVICGEESRLCQSDSPLLLADAVRMTGLPLAMPCGGNHTCGKCKAQAEGELTPPGHWERETLTAQELAAGIRLLCCARATGDCRVTLAAGGGAVTTAFRLDRAALRSAAVTGIGLAVDIGTTTVAAYLYDRGQGRPLAQAAALNDQRSFGADVISRIQYACDNASEPLRRAISAQVTAMADLCLHRAGRQAEELTGCVITGNTTMLHFLTGRDARSIARAPFTPASLFGETLPSSLLFGENGGCLAAQDIPVYLPTCVSGYVGADLVCALLNAGLEDREETALLVDIGTNGEMALYQQGHLYVCSTAAGPAFEGAGIEQGTQAVPGAICRVEEAGDRIRWETVDDRPPVGICGSGLIDAVAAFVRLGLITETGAIDRDADSPLLAEWRDAPALRVGDSGVILTQEDVRRFQLAKSAIRAGIDTLLDKTGLSPSDIRRFYVAGGFGSDIRPRSAVSVGLIPPEWETLYTPLFNAAAGGAVMLLLSPPLAEKCTATARTAEEVVLSGNPTFRDYYMEHMLFPPVE